MLNLMRPEIELKEIEELLRSQQLKDDVSGRGYS